MGQLQSRLLAPRARLAAWRATEGCLSAGVVAAQSHGLSDLFRRLAECPARPGRGSDRDRSAHRCRGRQDSAPQPRPPEGLGRIAFGERLGQRVWTACEDKSNEITAIPELLRLVDIRGAIITIDAMGTQKAIAAQVIDQQADYVLALKGNQGTLHEAVIAYIDQQLENDFAGPDVRQQTTTETGHGREETRCYTHLPAPRDLPHRDQWKGLKSIGVAITSCVRAGKETIEKRYYISSLPVGVKQFARAVRGHWGIENSCHWSLDMTFREDESRIRDRNLRENFAWLNRFLLSLLKQHPSKNSVVGKRRGCAWNDDFLLEVLTGITT